MSVVSYLKLILKPDYVAEFQRDLEELTQLVRQQKGFIGVQVLRTLDGAVEYVILSEWDSESDFRAWEHSPRHQEIMDDFSHRLGEGYTKWRMNRYR